MRLFPQIFFFFFFEDMKYLVPSECYSNTLCWNIEIFHISAFACQAGWFTEKILRKILYSALWYNFFFFFFLTESLSKGAHIWNFLM